MFIYLSPAKMEPLTLKQAILDQYNLNEQDFEKFVLTRTLFLRVKFIRPIVQFLNPDFLFNERRLIQKVGKSIDLKEIQEEVDFYQHKYVVNFVMKEALKFRLSGLKLIRLAHKVFNEAEAKQSKSVVLRTVQESPNP